LVKDRAYSKSHDWGIDIVGVPSVQMLLHQELQNNGAVEGRERLVEGLQELGLGVSDSWWS